MTASEICQNDAHSVPIAVKKEKCEKKANQWISTTVKWIKSMFKFVWVSEIDGICLKSVSTNEITYINNCNKVRKYKVKSNR